MSKFWWWVDSVFGLGLFALLESCSCFLGFMLGLGLAAIVAVAFSPDNEVGQRTGYFLMTVGTLTGFILPFLWLGNRMDEVIVETE